MLVSKQDLLDTVRSKIGDALFVVASNREPYVHVRSEEETQCIRPASGVVATLDCVMRACGGVWVAWGSGNADKEFVDENNGLMVPPGKGSYRLRRVWMSKKEEEGYYDIISNEMLYPLCLTVYIRPKFDDEAWKQYVRINERFVEAILSEIGDRNAFVWFQDFHLTLASKMIKEKRDNILSAHFWHVPWPHSERFRSCPWRKEILEGILANDLIGFQTRYNCNNFLDCVDRNLEAKTDRATYSVLYKQKETYLKPFPISVDFNRIGQLSDEFIKTSDIESLRRKYSLHNKIVFLGVERIDYAKGVPEKLKALDRFLRDNPEYIEKVVYIQIGAPSRIRLIEYHRTSNEISELVDEINWTHGTDKWSPVIYLPKHHDLNDVIKYYRLADYCIVSSLHDGMNIVAKEYVSAKTDLEGMLILSEFTGASEELREALFVNPYDVESFAKIIRNAVNMDSIEKRRRMQKMREVVEERNIYNWANKVISSLTRLA